MLQLPCGQPDYGGDLAGLWGPALMTRTVRKSEERSLWPCDRPCCFRYWFCLFMLSMSFWMEPVFLFMNWIYWVACFSIWARDVCKRIQIFLKTFLMHCIDFTFIQHSNCLKKQNDKKSTHTQELPPKKKVPTKLSVHLSKLWNQLVDHLLHRICVKKISLIWSQT